MSRLFLVTYEDGSTARLNLADAAFGTERHALHGDVVEARVAPQEPQEREDDWLPHNRLSRSLDIPPTMRSGIPVFGTGLDRKAS